MRTHNHDLYTNWMEQRPFWEADCLSASQEISCLLWNPKVHMYPLPTMNPAVPKCLSKSRPCVTFRNTLAYHGELLALPNPQPKGTHLVGYIRLLTEYILCFPSYQAFSTRSLKTPHAVVTKEVHFIHILRKRNNFICIFVNADLYFKFSWWISQMPGTCFTSPPKEVVLRFLIVLKTHRPRPGMN
jgi:hypothetical protein